MKRLVLESLLVAAIGAVFALTANALSPRGLKLARDYFPASAPRPLIAGTNASAPAVQPGSHTTTGAHGHSVLEHLREKGLNPADTQMAEQLFHDPRFEQNLIVFIDARDDDHYTQGHIPGAYQLDRFHPEKYLGEVLPACMGAQQVVVYCNGGECEDSEFAAILLRDSARIPNEKIFVYTGGIAEWKTKGLPIETGPRRSGQISTPAAPHK